MKLSNDKGGIFSAWKAGVIAFIRYPQAIKGADISVLAMSRQCLLIALESIRISI